MQERHLLQELQDSNQDMGSSVQQKRETAAKAAAAAPRVISGNVDRLSLLHSSFSCNIHMKSTVREGAPVGRPQVHMAAASGQSIQSLLVKSPYPPVHCLV